MKLPAIVAHADGILRGGSPLADWRGPVAIVVLFGPIYGAVMGSYALGSAERLLQVLYSATKVPLLLAASTLVCLPAHFVLSTVLGLRDDFRRSFGAILSGQAAMSVTLASLSPLTLVFYLSESDYSLALLFNAAAFALGAGAAQLVMRRGYRPLIERTRRHELMYWTWGALYVFVGVQMGWTLRPFVGHPGAFPTFFREEPFTNAYVEVAALLGRAVGLR